MPAADRVVSLMQEEFGTTSLVTDYGSLELREVLHDQKNKKMKTEDKELFSVESSWDYGLEPNVING
jgi:hypothetical protein